MMLNPAQEASIEKAAADVLKSLRIRSVPVDPCEIARQEGIQLAPGNYGAGFFGRLEYHRDPGTFILFHPDLHATPRSAIVRFSIGHELGHYYLPAHAALLRTGRAHSSTPNFICDNFMEVEADHFASNLLIPTGFLRERCGSRGWLDLDALLGLAKQCQTSATSAAVRYAKSTEEACAVVLSDGTKVIFSVSSQEAKASGWRWVEAVPSQSVTHRVHDGEGDGAIAGATSSTELWFPMAFHAADLWEEAYALGSTGLVLTLLARPESE